MFSWHIVFCFITWSWKKCPYKNVSSRESQILFYTEIQQIKSFRQRALRITKVSTFTMDRKTISKTTPHRVFLIRSSPNSCGQQCVLLENIPVFQNNKAPPYVVVFLQFSQLCFPDTLSRRNVVLWPIEMMQLNNELVSDCLKFSRDVISIYLHITWHFFVQKN